MGKDVVIRKDVWGKLEKSAQAEGREPTEVLRRAIGLYLAVTERGLSGYVNIEYPDGTKRRVYMK